MAIKKVTQAGQPVLRKRAKAVVLPVSKQIRRLIKDLTDTMRAADLIGIAAPQIGQAVRVFVTELAPRKVRSIKQKDALRVFINPVLHSYSKQQKSDWEGCGSVGFGSVFAKVKRPVSVAVRAVGIDEKPFEIRASGLLARVIQHEYDHLDGIFFTDKMDARTVTTAEEYRKMKRTKKKK